jgi:hypothetical protein
MVQYNISYETSYKNNFKTDVKAAVKFYLALSVDFVYSSDNWGGFILYPQALNPFLKIMETMGESRNIIILPEFNNDNKDKLNSPAYIIIKINNELSGYVKKLLLEK